MAAPWGAVIPMSNTLRNGFAFLPDKRRRTPLTVRWRAVRTYLAGASLRKTAFAMRFEYPFTHEAVRLWTQRLSHHLRVPPRLRDTVVVDETTVFLARGEERFVWAALDAHTREVLLVWVTQGRGGLEALLFLKNVLRRCKNEPFFMVDRGCWYPWAFEVLGVPWKVQRGGPRSLVESYFGSLKHRLQGMQRRPQTWHTDRTLPHLARAHAWWWNAEHA